MVATLLALALGSLALSAQAVVNVTVDDTDLSHVTYNPGAAGSPGWNAEPGCAACSLKPDPTQCFNNTWHDDLWIAPDSALYANITFTGTAVYLFNIIPNNEINANTNLTFVVDGDESTKKNFTYQPNNQSAFLYNFSVFSATGLQNAQHTVQMSTFGDNSTGDLAILFDYFIYTSENASASSSTSQTGSATGTASSSKSSATSPTSSTGTSASTTPTSAASVKHRSVALVLASVVAAMWSLL